MTHKFKVGDRVACTTPTIVGMDFFGEVGVVADIADFSDRDTGEQIITISYGDCEQTAYVELDGVESVEPSKKAPTELTEGTSKGIDNVNSPSHYGQGKIEAIDYIQDFLTKEEYIGYLRGNIAKYMHRFRYKGKALEDLRKAEWYHKRLIGVFEDE